MYLEIGNCTQVCTFIWIGNWPDYVSAYFGSTGCRVFRQGGTTKLERFLPKNQRTKRKLMNFESWYNGELFKSDKIWQSMTIFYVKNHRYLSIFFFSLNNVNLGAHFLKWCLIFDTSLLHQFSKFNNFLWVCWFLGMNLSNFLPPAWKIDNPYYHSTYLGFIWWLGGTKMSKNDH